MDSSELARQLLSKHLDGADLNTWIGLLAEAGVAESTIVSAIRASAGNHARFAKELERKGVRPDLIVSAHKAAGGSGITQDALHSVSTGGIGFGWLPSGSPNWTNFYGKF